MGRDSCAPDFIDAIDMQDAARVAALLARDPALVSARVPVASEGGALQTMLHRAIPGDGEPATEERSEIVRLLLDAGADPNGIGYGANHGPCPPLTMAAWGGHPDLIRMLIERGANPNGSPECSPPGRRPIDTAADHGHGPAVEALIDAGADYRLEHLLKAGIAERVAGLLGADPDLARQSLGGASGATTPLHLALAAGRGAGLVDPLLDHGADVNARDDLGRTPLHVAIETDEKDAWPLLIERGAEIDLFAAAGMARTDEASRWLEKDPSFARITQADGLTPLFYAAWSGDEATARRLLDLGAEVGPRVRRVWACLTPLHAAIQRRHPEMTALLLARGADPNAFAAVPGRYWPTPLHEAARWGTLEDVQLLLRHGADPNGGSPVPDSMDAGPLAWATAAGSAPLVEQLIEHGLDLHAPRHQSLLRMAVERGHDGLKRFLVHDPPTRLG